jgi:hypothetical protein
MVRGTVEQTLNQMLQVDQMDGTGRRTPGGRRLQPGREKIEILHHLL